MYRFSGFVRDLLQMKRVLFISTAVFILGIYLGTVGSDALHHFLTSQISGLSEISKQLEKSRHQELSFFLFIFFNNAIKGVLIIFLGALFGILPLFFLLVNGMVIGFVVKMTVDGGADLSDLIIKGLLPHGIIEIPTILIACAYGLQLGGLVFRSMGSLFQSEKRALIGSEWGQFMMRAGRASIWIVVLMCIAAIIESTLTYHLLR
ncbi:stage II sporulation protein M [Paenibacillus sediminis]|uniref:Stage II sporulation protein M n=1 Tax=Paenibacillus sediminis TaxID=664909 RepID=A0ABS4H741_9BACL|nr:stage II sporulation protein M [Paenibacillus sediminis]MBP1938340.1 stage II sporulation protein M [Paenibacillus sediminis]